MPDKCEVLYMYDDNISVRGELQLQCAVTLHT